jgi:pyruvate,water dikinase
MYIRDLDTGLTEKRQKTITINDIDSAPLQALWKGLKTEDTNWQSGLYHADWEQLDRISAGIFTKEAKFLSSYTLFSGDYLHMMIRFGYHFTVLDSVCGPNEKSNYIRFRFKGGGAGLEGRYFRLFFIKRILRPYGFDITIRSDMLDAKKMRHDEKTIRQGLLILGRILAQTRLLDMRLEDQAHAEAMAEQFLAAWYGNG